MFFIFLLIVANNMNIERKETISALKQIGNLIIPIKIPQITLENHRIFRSENNPELSIDIYALNKYENLDKLLDDAFRIFECHFSLEKILEAEKYLLILEKILVEDFYKQFLRTNIIEEIINLKAIAEEINLFEFHIAGVKNLKSDLSNFEKNLALILFKQYKHRLHFIISLEILKKSFVLFTCKIKRIQSKLISLTYNISKEDLKKFKMAKILCQRTFEKFTEEIYNTSNITNILIKYIYIRNTIPFYEYCLKIKKELEPLIQLFPSSLENKQLELFNRFKELNDNLFENIEKRKQEINLNKEYNGEEFSDVKKEINKHVFKINQFDQEIMLEYINLNNINQTNSSDSVKNGLKNFISSDGNIDIRACLRNFNEIGKELLHFLRNEYKKTSEIYKNSIDEVSKSKAKKRLDFIFKSINDRFVFKKIKNKQSEYELRISSEAEDFLNNK